MFAKLLPLLRLLLSLVLPKIMPAVRHGIAVAAGMLLASGYVNANGVELFTAAALAAANFGWYCFDAFVKARKLTA